MDRAEFEPRTPVRKADFTTTEIKIILRRQAQTITTESQRILLVSVVMVLAFRPGVLGSNSAWSLYFCYAFVNLFLCYGLCYQDNNNNNNNDLDVKNVSPVHAFSLFPSVTFRCTLFFVSFRLQDRSRDIV